MLTSWHGSLPVLLHDHVPMFICNYQVDLLDQTGVENQDVNGNEDSSLPPPLGFVSLRALALALFSSVRLFWFRFATTHSGWRSEHAKHAEQTSSARTRAAMSGKQTPLEEPLHASCSGMRLGTTASPGTKGNVRCPVHGLQVCRQRL